MYQGITRITYHESRDVFVVVNMINAMLNRYMGIPHRLHRDLDKAYITLKMLPLGDGEEWYY